MARRAEIRVDPVQAARPAQLRARAPAAELAVEVHGDAEPPELLGEHQRLGAGGAAVGLLEVDDRGDVDDAHARVQARVRA